MKADAERALRAMCEGTKGTTRYPSVNTAEHRADMAVLSVDHVVIATASMLGRIRKTAEMRMALEATEK